MLHFLSNLNHFRLHFASQLLPARNFLTFSYSFLFHNLSGTDYGMGVTTPDCALSISSRRHQIPLVPFMYTNSRLFSLLFLLLSLLIPFFFLFRTDRFGCRFSFKSRFTRPWIQRSAAPNMAIEVQFTLNRSYSMSFCSCVELSLCAVFGKSSISLVRL